MFQLFLRARARNDFHARSSDRDAETDQSRIAAISAAIDAALQAAEAEQAGLKRRLNDVLARASVTFGNDSDEYVTREPLDSHHQNLFGTEIANAERRLKELSAHIGHFKFLKTALSTRFSDFKAPAEKLAQA
jgi:hypothetical protein